MEIQGFPDYLIYEDGRVFSKKTRKFMKCNDNGRGYLQVSFNLDKIYTHKIHRLVALHYIPNPNNYPQVDHIDRDKTNNDVSNLRWVDNSMNALNRGERCDNKSGHTNIYYLKCRDRWIYKKTIRGVDVRKYFKTLEEAVAYKSTIDS